jgi:glucokinase-like ROK family protein
LNKDLISSFKAGSKLKHGIIKQLYVEKNLSCVDLSQILGKSIPVIAKTLNELLKEEYITEHGYAPSSGGRRPLMYSLKPDKMYIVAVAMDQFFTRIAVMDLFNNYVSQSEIIELPLHDNDHAAPFLIKLVNDHIDHSGIIREKIIGVGIGMPGFINVKEGINHTFLTNIPDGNSLRTHLEKNIGLPIYIDNDSSLIALAEHRFGLAKGRKNVMVINIGWGTGLGMIVKGELFRGHSGYAGEFSHIPVSDNDILCECGKNGCLETEASLLMLVQKATHEIKNGRISGLKVKDIKYMYEPILDAANKGDQFSIGLLSDMGYNLGKGIAILIHIMNPELIVLSGRGAGAGKILIAPIQQALNKYCIPRLAENTELSVSQLGYDAEIIGAAALVMENFGISHMSVRTEEFRHNLEKSVN